MKIPAFLPTIRRVPVHWLFEASLIVMSVALGFWVTQLQEVRQDREHAARVLSGLRAEVEHNRRVLEPFVPMHEQWTEALAKADTSISGRSGMDVYFATVRLIQPARSPLSRFYAAARGTWLCL